MLQLQLHLSDKQVCCILRSALDLTVVTVLAALSHRTHDPMKGGGGGGGGGGHRTYAWKLFILRFVKKINIVQQNNSPQRILRYLTYKGVLYSHENVRRCMHHYFILAAYFGHGNCSHRTQCLTRDNAAYDSLSQWVNSVSPRVRKLHFMYEVVRTSSKYRWGIYRASRKCQWSNYRTSRKRR